MLDELLERLKKNEGFSSTVYDDHLGIPTIGYGFAIKDLEITEEWASDKLAELVDEKYQQLISKLDWYADMPPMIQGVILEMVYQMGFTGFCKFKKTIAHFKEKEFKYASEEMLDSLWARQTPPRAKRLAELVWSHG